VASAAEMFGILGRSNYGKGRVRLPLLCETVDQDVDLPAYLVNCVKYNPDLDAVYVSVHSLQGAYLTTYCIRSSFGYICAAIAYALGFKDQVK